MSILEQIVASRRAQLNSDRSAANDRAVAAAAERIRQTERRHRLRYALQQGINIIAEFKRRSPSAGLINAHADPGAIARRYEAAGACAVSVLTEPRFFGGSLGDLSEVRCAVSLPVLRKDFIFDCDQVDEAAAARADAVLLITAILSDAELMRLRVRIEQELGMDALVEVHAREELDRAVECGATLIGVNNRNLHTFETSIDVSIELASFAPRNVTLVSESGISSPEQVRSLLQCGYRGFLVGESLMRAPDPAELIRSLKSAGDAELRHV